MSLAVGRRRRVTLLGRVEFGAGGADVRGTGRRLGRVLGPQLRQARAHLVDLLVAAQTGQRGAELIAGAHQLAAPLVGRARGGEIGHLGGGQRRRHFLLCRSMFRVDIQRGRAGVTRAVRTSDTSTTVDPAAVIDQLCPPTTRFAHRRPPGECPRRR